MKKPYAPPPLPSRLLFLAGFAAIAYLLKMLLEFQKIPSDGRGKPKRQRE